MQYPEHEKLNAIREHSQAIHEFIIYLGNKKGYWLGSYDHDPNSIHNFQRSWLDITKEVAEFYGIDLKKLEEEKTEMLAAIRNIATLPDIIPDGSQKAA